MLSHDGSNLFCDAEHEIIDRLKNTPHYFKGEYETLLLHTDGVFRIGVDLKEEKGILEWESIDWPTMLDECSELLVYGDQEGFTRPSDIWRCVKSQIDEEVMRAMVEAMPEFDEF